MHAAREFRRQRCVDRPVPFDAALATKSLRHDIDAVMSLSAGPMSGMSSMQVGFVFDTKAFRCESFGQFLCDDIFCLHVQPPAFHRDVGAFMLREHCAEQRLFKAASNCQMSRLEGWPAPSSY